MTGDKAIESTGREAQLGERLRALAVDPPDHGFRAALHQRLLAEGLPGPVPWSERIGGWLRDRRPWLWPASGLAAGLAAYVLLLVIHGNPLRSPSISHQRALTEAETGQVLPSYRVPTSKVAVIKLAFAAEVAVEDVTFEVKLPDGLSFWSDGQRLAERSFRWPGRLDAGENIIPIAVRGDRPGRYPVLATVEIGGRVLQHRVVMDVRKEGT